MNLLIGTDGSDEALDAARYALSLLGPIDDVIVACVVDPPAAASAGFESGFAGGAPSPEDVDKAWAEVNREADEVLQRTIGALTTSATVTPVILAGSPGPELCQLAAERQVDVVAVGSRGRGAIKRALLGSVSAHVANNAPCSVLIGRSADS